MEYEMKPSRPTLDDIDGRILRSLNHEQFLTVRSIAQVLGLAPMIVYQRLTMSLDMKFRHFQ
jgi:DNA-binding Lrp family transcriptional regulator